MEDNLYNSAFPRQKLPLSKKGKKWQEDCVNYIIGEGNVTSGGNSTSYYGELQTYYNLYNSIFDEKDFKSITNPFKVEDGFPATPHDFNIIRPKVDLLIGEETKRPLNFRVIRTSQEATSEMQEKEKEMILQYIEAAITARMSPEEAQQFQEQIQSGEVMPPEQIAKYMDKDYKDIVENTAYHTLTYLREKLDLDNEFIKGWKDGLISGREIYYVGVLNAEPYVERVNPIYFSYDKSPDLEFVEDGSWCCRKMRMPITEVYDRYYDKLEEKDLDKLEEMIGSTPGRNLGDRSPIDMGIQLRIYDNPMFEGSGKSLVNVWHCCWKSFKKIFYVTTTDDAGQPQINIVDETYQPVGNEISVEPDWIVEVWEGYRAGSDLYFGVQPIEYQHVSIDNPNSQKLPYCGAIYSNTNSKPRSLVSILKPLQYMYIVLWYRLELAIARDKGKVINMDITQIPKSMSISPAKWMHYLSSVGVNFINPYEEGWCFDPNTLVATPSGNTKMKDIKLGQFVYTPGHHLAQVTNLFHGEDEMYNIIPSIGSDVQKVTADHLVRYRYRINGHSDSEVRVDKAKDLMLKFKQNKYYAQRCFLEREDNFFDPKEPSKFGGRDMYLLGLWLGDGTKNTPEFESMDPEIIQYLEDYACTHGLRCSYRHKDGSRSMTIRLSSANNKKKGQTFLNPFIEDLRYFGVYDNKEVSGLHIDNIDDALNFLAGLIDTDGSVFKGNGNHKGYVEFTQCESHKDIFDLFVDLARKLGYRVSVKRKESVVRKIYKNKTITISEPFYKARIFDGNYDIPTKVERKKFHFTQGRVYNKNYSHFKIEYAGRGEYYGFAIDDPKHEFLLSDMTIVHNCIPGREGGKPAQFNQITALDLTMSNVIAEYIQLMDKIEELAGTISGITQQREGAVSSSEMVGNVERSVVQSSHITEPLFWVHNQCKRRVLNMLLNTAKGAWEETGKQKLQYIFDNGERAFLDITPKFYYEDMDVFVSDTSKDLENIQKLQQLIQPAMQNGASLLEAAEVLTNDNFNIIKQKLKDMQTRQEQMQQQQQEAEAQQQQQLQQMQNEAKQQELMLQEAQMDLQRYQIDQDNQTKIAVAQINAYRGVEDMDQNENGTPDVMELGKQALEQQKINQDAYNKRYEAKQKREIEDQKIQLEKDKMKHETELQSQKDKAAMEREQLKARTAIRNKTNAEAARGK